MAKAKKFMGRAIKTRTIALGVGGEIRRDEDEFDPPPNALVTFKAQATFDKVSHKFDPKDGQVKEIYVLTTKASSVEILAVEEQPEQLAIEDDTDAPPPGDDDEPGDAA